MLDKQEQIFELLRERIVSEKSQRLESLNVMVLKVRKNASKEEVAQAVELFFETKVKKVNLLNMKGKVKHSRGRRICQSGWKKAYVTLMAGDAVQSNQAEASHKATVQAGEV